MFTVALFQAQWGMEEDKTVAKATFPNYWHLHWAMPCMGMDNNVGEEVMIRAITTVKEKAKVKTKEIKVMAKAKTTEVMGRM